MADHLPEPFRHAARRVLENPALRASYRMVTERFVAHRTAGLGEVDADALLAEAENIRARTVAELPALAAEFVANFEANGGKAHIAATAADARAIVETICHTHAVRRVVKSKTMTGEEIGLTAALEAARIRVTETDLGERIIQLAAEPPAHIIAPSIEFDRHRVTELFQKKLGMAKTTDIAELTRQARVTLREDFRRADLGITGANFVVADAGCIAIVTNEGNARMGATVPPIHIAIAGREKLVPTLADVAALQKTLMRGSTGQHFTTYFQILSGPRRAGELDGPAEMHVILLDNGRERIRADADFADALRCIRCSSCLNVCPVYSRSGARAYGGTYPGPIGTVLTSLADPARMADLAEACTLCGACTAICPVGIDLENMHLDLRAHAHDRTEKVGTAATNETAIRPEKPPRARRWRLLFGMYGFLVRRPKLWRFAARMAGMVGGWFGKSHDGWASRSPMAWTLARDAKLPARESFQQWWQREGKDLPPAEPISLPTSLPIALPNSAPIALPAPLPIAVPLRETFDAALAKAGGEIVTDLAAFFRAAPPGFVWLDELGEWEPMAREAAQRACREIRRRSTHAGDAAPARGWFDAGFSRAAVGVTRAHLAIADTGTVVELAGSFRTRGASLVPPWHIVLLTAGDVVPDIETALARLPRPLPSAVNFITGPSRTADIEQTLTIGVHGPLKMAAFWLP